MTQQSKAKGQVADCEHALDLRFDDVLEALVHDRIAMRHEEDERGEVRYSPVKNPDVYDPKKETAENLRVKLLCLLGLYQSARSSVGSGIVPDAWFVRQLSDLYDDPEYQEQAKQRLVRYAQKWSEEEEALSKELVRTKGGRTRQQATVIGSGLDPLLKPSSGEPTSEQRPAVVDAPQQERHVP